MNTATVTLSDLKDSTTYDIYLSATNSMPYNDVALFHRLEDSEVLKVTVTTLFNYSKKRKKKIQSYVVFF